MPNKGTGSGVRLGRRVGVKDEEGRLFGLRNKSSPIPNSTTAYFLVR